MGLMAWTRPPASGNWTRPKDPDASTTSLALAALDLSGTASVYNPNSMTYSVSDQGSDVWRVSLTGDGSVRDGVSEGVTLIFTPKDADGNTIDLTEAKHSVHWNLKLHSVSGGDDLIVMFGVVASSGGTPQWVRLSGFTTFDDGGDPRRSVATSVNSNSTTGAASLAVVRGHYVPVPITGSTWQGGGMVTWTLNSSGEEINSFETGPVDGNSSHSINLCLFLGFDPAAHTDTKTADIKLSTAISQSWT
jgi:hypothetical protein